MPVLIKVSLATAEQPNPNGRIYPRQLLERVVRQHDPAKTMAFVHDDSGLVLQNVIGQVQHLQLAEDGRLYGTIKLIDTAPGLDVQELCLNDYQPKFSMSGAGTVRDGVVQDDYHFDGVTVDMSTWTKDAKLRKILRMKQRKHYATARPAEDHRSYPC
jgi:hypothetical protein